MVIPFVNAVMHSSKLTPSILLLSRVTADDTFAMKINKKKKILEIIQIELDKLELNIELILTIRIL